MNSIHDVPEVIGVKTLRPTERLFLWAIRAWSAYHSDLTGVWWSLDKAFAQEGIHSALPPFHQMMSALFANWNRWPDIRCVACPRLGFDEARLLSVFSDLQRDNELGARQLLQGRVARSAVRVVCMHARECVEIAPTAGLRFASSEPHADVPAVESMCAEVLKRLTPANNELPAHSA